MCFCCMYTVYTVCKHTVCENVYVHSFMSAFSCVYRLDSYLICTVLYNYYFDLYIVSYNENIQLNFSNAVDFYLFFILSP